MLEPKSVHHCEFRYSLYRPARTSKALLFIPTKAFRAHNNCLEWMCGELPVHIAPTSCIRCVALFLHYIYIYINILGCRPPMEYHYLAAEHVYGHQETTVAFTLACSLYRESEDVAVWPWSAHHSRIHRNRRIFIDGHTKPRWWNGTNIYWTEETSSIYPCSHQSISEQRVAIIADKRRRYGGEEDTLFADAIKKWRLDINIKLHSIIHRVRYVCVLTHSP